MQNTGIIGKRFETHRTTWNNGVVLVALASLNSDTLFCIFFQITIVAIPGFACIGLVWLLPEPAFNDLSSL